MTAEERLVLHFVHLANGNQDVGVDFNADWQKVYTIACLQGVSCLVFDDLETLVKHCGKDGVHIGFGERSAKTNDVC